MRSPAPAPEHEPELHGTPWYWSACFASRGRVVHHFARLHHLSSCASRCTLRRLRNSPRATEIRSSQQLVAAELFHLAFMCGTRGFSQVCLVCTRPGPKRHQSSINHPSTVFVCHHHRHRMISPRSLHVILCFVSRPLRPFTKHLCVRHRERHGVREFIFSCTSSRRWLALKSTYGEPLAAPHRYSQVLSFAYCTQQSHALHCHRRGAHRLAATFAFTFL